MFQDNVLPPTPEIPSIPVPPTFRTYSNETTDTESNTSNSTSTRWHNRNSDFEEGYHAFCMLFVCSIVWMIHWKGLKNCTIILNIQIIIFFRFKSHFKLNNTSLSHRNTHLNNSTKNLSLFLCLTNTKKCNSIVQFSYLTNIEQLGTELPPVRSRQIVV